MLRLDWENGERLSTVQANYDIHTKMQLLHADLAYLLITPPPPSYPEVSQKASYFYAYFILDVMKPLKNITTVETKRLFHRFFAHHCGEDISRGEYKMFQE